MTSKYAQTANAGRPTVWVYRNGNEIETREQTQEERLEQQIPPRGEYRLKVKAFAEPFEMPRAEKFGGGVQQMTRLLLEVQNGPGAGKKTTLLTSFMFGPRSNLGKVFTAITGNVIVAGMECDPVDMLEGEFTAYLQPSPNLDDNGKPKGTDCSWDTVAAVTEMAATGTDGDDTWS